MAELLHHLLSESAEKTPEKIAARFKDEEISYGALHLASGRLASLLTRRGVRTGDQVGLLIDKSIDSLIAIFSILKAGASYVPLDPMAPADRQTMIIHDCSLKYLVTSSKKMGPVKKIMEIDNPLRLVFVPDLESAASKTSVPEEKLVFKDSLDSSEANPPDDQAADVTPPDLAYILYTSGSTGKPKGVMISHGAAMAFVNWSCRTFGLDSSENISSVAPFHFDLSIFDIYASIKAGATICIVPQGLSLFPKSLAEFIEEKRISTWYSVPSLLIQLILNGNLQERDFSRLRRILFAGEVFPTKYLRKLMALIPRAEYYNLFGPTETNVCTYHHVNALPASDDQSISIGKVCSGHDFYIVDDEGRPVADDRIGELYIIGPNLMEGYWGDPQKTGKVLIRNPFSEKGERCCKTGDMVRMTREGWLEYHGRRDNMIKSRGYRIELGEIEAVLASHELIGEVAVLGIPDEKIGHKIKAVVVLKENDALTPMDLKLYCSKKLPNYMVPADIAFAERMPKTSTGKIDRHKLRMESL
jgi:amino acid adenylation domain-containing protein